VAVDHPLQAGRKRAGLGLRGSANQHPAGKANRESFHRAIATVSGTTIFWSFDPMARSIRATALR